jgi:hypothetical protein
MDIDLQLFKNIMAESRHNSDLLDSFSPNQFKSKERLINLIKKEMKSVIKSEVVILGCWYGSILIPSFKHSKRITLIDKDEKVISIAKNRLFNHYKNLDFICDDVFNWAPNSSRIKKTDLIINASCENMKSMKKLNLNTNAYFAFQSNNMYEIHDSVNCVSSIEEFKWQMPDNVKILKEDTLRDDRGTRFTLIGKYEKNNL